MGNSHRKQEQASASRESQSQRQQEEEQHEQIQRQLQMENEQYRNELERVKMELHKMREQKKRKRYDDEGEDEEGGDTSRVDTNGKRRRTVGDLHPAAAAAAAAPSQEEATEGEEEEEERGEVVITLSGFKNSEDYEYNKQTKKVLGQKVESLKGRLLKDGRGDNRELLDERVTHVVAPSYARTMKVLQAILNGKWIVCPEWIERSYESGEWLDEKEYGFHREENPVRDKKIYLTKGFMHSFENELTLTHCQQLVQRGGGSFTEDANNADFILVGKASAPDADAPSYSRDYPAAYVCEWPEFIDCLYPVWFETRLKKASLKAK